MDGVRSVRKRKEGVPKAGRPNQRSRTRKDLLQAASRLMRQGRKPSLEEVAEEALVSRATAYRYFPSIEALVLEAALDIATPSVDVLDKAPADDPVARLGVVDDTLDAMMAANETQMRLMLANALQRSVEEGGRSGVPLRQNRRSVLIDAALSPARKQFRPAAYDMLAQAMALVVGTEAHIAFKDVLQVDDAEARKVKRWMIRALVEAAKK